MHLVSRKWQESTSRGCYGGRNESPLSCTAGRGTEQAGDDLLSPDRKVLTELSPDRKVGQAQWNQAFLRGGNQEVLRHELIWNNETFGKP